MGSPTPALPPGKWWRDSFSMVQTNLREIDVTMDVEKVLDFIEGHGATAWLIGVGGIQAQYPTNLDFHWTNPNLSQRADGDLVGAAVKAAHARGIRLCARMDFSKITTEVAEEHPDWCYRSPGGELQTHTGGLVSVCPSGDWYQKRIFDILEEVMSRYPLDGFFFNWTGMNEEDYFKVYHGVCHCDRCQEGWKRFTGSDIELPNGREDEAYPRWIAFGREVVGEVLGRVQKLIYLRLPDAGLIRSDIRFHEANNSVGRPFWPFNTSEAVSAFKSVDPTAPVFVNSTAFYDMPYRMASENAPRFAQYLLQGISRGGCPSTYMMGTPGKVPYDCLPIAGEITRFHRKHMDVYRNLRPASQTALIRPDDANLDKTAYENATKEFRGLYKAMQERHVFFDVVPQEAIAESGQNGIQNRYRRMILPDLGTMRGKEVSALEAWVRFGGRLVLTGSSGLSYGLEPWREGHPQFKNHPAKRCNKIVTDPKDVWSQYICPTRRDQDLHYYPSPITPIYGHYLSYDWKDDVSKSDSELGWAPFAPPEKAYGNLPNGKPGSATMASGKGGITVIPFTPGRGYLESGLLSIRQYFETVLATLPVDDDVKVELAEQVEVTLSRNDSGLVLHLVNVSGIGLANFTHHLPIPGGRLKVGSGVRSVRTLVNDKSLDVQDGVVTLPVLDLWEVLVLEQV